MKLTDKQLTDIAAILESAMTVANFMDDYDEVISGFIDEDPESAEVYHKQMMLALEFINDRLEGRDYNLDEFQQTYLNQLE